MPSLREINEIFCEGAAEIRYVRPGPDGPIWTNFVAEPDPYEVSFVRSIRYSNDGWYLYFLDIDSPRGLTEELLKDSYLMHKRVSNFLGIEPIMKFSGKYGVHICFDLFLKPEDRNEIDSKLLRLGFSLWVVCSMSDKILFGAFKKKEVYRPFIDARLFSHKRMIRSFSIHLGSGLYSVPILPQKDSREDIMRRAQHPIDLPAVELPSLTYDASMAIYEPPELRFSKGPVDPPNLPDANGDEIDDEVFKALPGPLQAIVVNEGDPDHLRDKWPVVAYIAWAFPEMSSYDICKWIWNNCKWSDLNNWGKTYYNVNWTTEWTRSREDKDRPPVWGWCLNGN